jgi:hypothetical protein
MLTVTKRTEFLFFLVKLFFEATGRRLPYKQAERLFLRGMYYQCESSLMLVVMHVLACQGQMCVSVCVCVVNLAQIPTVNARLKCMNHKSIAPPEPSLDDSNPG